MTPRVPLLRLTPKIIKNQLIRGSQSTLFAFKVSQFAGNWPPENSNFGLLKNRQPKGTCLRSNLSFEQNKVWGKNFEYHPPNFSLVLLKIFSPHFILLKAQIAPQACAFGLPTLQKAKIAVFRWPIASKSDINE